MSVAVQLSLRTTALWPQGDIRDPLGVWGVHGDLVADATGGEIIVTVVTELARAAAYVYTLLDAFMVQNTGILNSDRNMIEINTNWPNIQQAGGVQPYTPSRFGLWQGGSFATPPNFGVGTEHLWVTPNQRFLPIWDPRGLTSTLSILTFKLTNDPDAATFTCQAYGYFWDRSVMGAPGGLRHPGAS